MNSKLLSILLLIGNSHLIPMALAQRSCEFQNLNNKFVFFLETNLAALLHLQSHHFHVDKINELGKLLAARIRSRVRVLSWSV